jgi:hypothetical protein
MGGVKATLMMLLGKMWAKAYSSALREGLGGALLQAEAASVASVLTQSIERSGAEEHQTVLSRSFSNIYAETAGDSDLDDDGDSIKVASAAGIAAQTGTNWAVRGNVESFATLPTQSQGLNPATPCVSGEVVVQTTVLGSADEFLRVLNQLPIKLVKQLGLAQDAAFTVISWHAEIADDIDGSAPAESAPTAP